MKTLSDSQALNTLTHPQRLQILQYLMEYPATLSQLGSQFNESPAHIRHHLKILEQKGWIARTEPPPAHNHLEKYYQATEEAWLIQLTVLPHQTDTPCLILASKDHAARQMIGTFNRQGTGINVQLLPLNSLDGLVMLRQGLCQMATCHLKEPGSSEYNRSFVRHLFPGQKMAVVRLYHREEGLIVRAGNPLGIKTLSDLARPEVRFINREGGAGIRVWLDQALKNLGLAPDNISDYVNEARSHAEVAQSVHAGRADIGLGIVSAARALGLDFIPLFEEPYELVLPAERLTSPACAPFFEHLNSGAFRTSVQTLDGYLIPPTSGQVDWVE
ncbi:MAG: substrate-binding domain-containing protein [Anaerolineales bacterium]|nr:substrate-binding domain-containing protein [Anaerolineales bacterium]